MVNDIYHLAENSSSELYMNLTPKISGRGIYSSNLKEIALLENPQFCPSWSRGENLVKSHFCEKSNSSSQSKPMFFKFYQKHLRCLSFPCSSQRIWTSITLQLLGMELLPLYVNLPCLREARWLQKPVKMSTVYQLYCIWSKATATINGQLWWIC